MQSGPGPGVRSPGGAVSGGTASNDGPALAGGVAAVRGGTVVATVTPNSAKVGRRVRVTQVATAPVDGSGHFVLRPDPTSRPLARAIVQAIRTNGGWVNLGLIETGADGRTAITDISRQYVDASGKPFSVAEFRSEPRDGHWIGTGTGDTTVDPRDEVALPSSRGSGR